jgi:hypothetical protein
MILALGLPIGELLVAPGAEIGPVVGADAGGGAGSFPITAGGGLRSTYWGKVLTAGMTAATAA